MKIKTYSEFWPFYLKEHSHPLNRLLHFIGTSLGIALLLEGLISGRMIFLLIALVSGYAFAWVGHFFIEKNKPATFQYPFWSFISDFRMWFLMLIRKL